MIANAKDFRIIARHDELAVAEVMTGRCRKYAVIEMSGNDMVVALAYRTTEAQARKKANDIWISNRAA